MFYKWTGKLGVILYNLFQFAGNKMGLGSYEQIGGIGITHYSPISVVLA